MSLNALTAIGHLSVEKNCPPFSALLHPLVVPESLEEHSNSRTISLKTQPKFTLFEWQEPQTKQSVFTFVGDVAPMFLSSREPILASEAKALPSGSTRGLSVKFPVDEKNSGSIPLKPLEHLQPLRLGSLRALCSALLSADRPPTIKTLSQRIFDGNKFMNVSSKPDENFFRDLMEDLGAATPTSGPFSSCTSTLDSAEKSATKEASSSSTTSHTMSRLLQWALFLSSPAGHVTPLSIIDGSKDNSPANYNTSSNVTAQQLRDKSFELQVRFYSFIDERCVLACHLPASSAELESKNLASPSSASVSANGAPAVLSAISNKILTTLIKQQKSAVIESATSVHGLIPVPPDALSSSAAIRENNETRFVVDTTLFFVRKATSSSAFDTQKESDFDFDDNCSDIGSLASGVSGTSNALHRVQLSHKNFLEAFGPKEENVGRFRAVTTIASLIFANIVASFVKYVSSETLARLRALSSDPAAGNKALFSTAGLTVVGAIDMSWLDHILANGNNDHQANESALNLNRSLFVDGIVVPCSLHQFARVQKTEKALLDLANGLRKAAETLPKLLAEHHLKNPPNAADPDTYCTDTAYARVQRPVVNFLSRVFTLAIEGRAKRIEADRQAKIQTSGEGSGTRQSFEGTRAAEKASESFENFLSLDLTFSGWSGTADGKPSSLDIMVIKRANVTSPASTVDSGIGSRSAVSERPAFATTVQLEAIRSWATYLTGRDASASTAARRGVLDTLDAIVTAALDNINIAGTGETHPQGTKASHHEPSHGKREREVNNTAAFGERANEKMRRSEDEVRPSIQRLHHLADLPFKVRFSWGKFYENPSAISTAAQPSSSASASAGTLWSRTSHTEQHWVEKLEEAKKLISAEFIVKRKLQNKDQSAAVLVSMSDAIKALTSTAAVEPTSVLSLVEILAKLDIGFELSANLAIRRLPSSPSESHPPPPLGVVEWVLAHSDAVLRAKCSAGDTKSKTASGGGGFEALLALSDPRLAPCLNSSEKNHVKLAQSDVASSAMSQVNAFVAKTSTRIDRMKKLRAELLGFVFDARNSLDAYESLALEVADFLESELMSAADKHRANFFERISFDEAQHHPLGLVAKGLGKSFSHVSVTAASTSQSTSLSSSIPIVDLDNVAAATRVELHCEDELLAASIGGDDKLSSSTCLTATLISEIGSFAFAHSKRARRLRGLVRIAEELAKGLLGAIHSAEEEKWLVSC